MRYCMQFNWDIRVKVVGSSMTHMLFYTNSDSIMHMISNPWRQCCKHYIFVYARTRSRARTHTLPPHFYEEEGDQHLQLFLVKTIPTLKISMNCQKRKCFISKISPLKWHFPFLWTAIISRQAYEKKLIIFLNLVFPSDEFILRILKNVFLIYGKWVLQPVLDYSDVNSLLCEMLGHFTLIFF